jgi:hypothetical protein
VGPVGIAPTPVAEGEVRNVQGGYPEQGVLSNNRASGLLCVKVVEELLDC